MTKLRRRARNSRSQCQLFSQLKERQNPERKDLFKPHATLARKKKQENTKNPENPKKKDFLSEVKVDHNY